MLLDDEYSFDFGVDNKSVSETLDDKIATLESDLKRTKDKIETLNCDFGRKEGCGSGKNNIISWNL